MINVVYDFLLLVYVICFICEYSVNIECFFILKLKYDLNWNMIEKFILKYKIMNLYFEY